MVFAQELSDDELETVSGGRADDYVPCAGSADSYYPCGEAHIWSNEHCVNTYQRSIYEGTFPNYAATVEDGSWCWSNDACSCDEVVYNGMNDCSKAWM